MAEQAGTAGEARRRAIGAVAVEVVVNIALPFAIYALGKARWGDAGALMISSGPPIAWSISAPVCRITRCAPRPRQKV